jgi:4-hydroxyphenylpyruvate dioxygenase
MRRSIATVSLSGPLNEKLTACAAAGFDGVEIFDQDLITSLWTPSRIRERCDELGLRIEMLQPVRDLEGLTPAQHEQAMRRFAGKLDIMQQLGTDLVLVCASCRPDAIDDDHLSAEQLRVAADMADQRGMRIAFEALAWSTNVWDYRRAWKIVQLADHPALGTCQDTFHVLSRGLDPFHIRDIPGEKIFFVQLSDAPQLSMDILQWSRHHRVWPGQGSWDVAGFVEHCLLAGYTGPLSLEIFNTVFRRADAARNARDALRSLLYVEDAVAHRGVIPATRLEAAPPAPVCDGVDFVELTVKPDHPKFVTALTGLGFTHVADHLDKPIELWQQGQTRMLLNSMEAAGGAGRPAHRRVGDLDRRPGRRDPTRTPPSGRPGAARARPEHRRHRGGDRPRRHRRLLHPLRRPPRALDDGLPSPREPHRTGPDRPAAGHRRGQPLPAGRQLRRGSAVLPGRHRPAHP